MTRPAPIPRLTAAALALVAGPAVAQGLTPGEAWVLRACAEGAATEAEARLNGWTTVLGADDPRIVLALGQAMLGQGDDADRPLGIVANEVFQALAADPGLVLMTGGPAAARDSLALGPGTCRLVIARPLTEGDLALPNLGAPLPVSAPWGTILTWSRDGAPVLRALLPETSHMPEGALPALGAYVATPGTAP